MLELSLVLSSLNGILISKVEEATFSGVSTDSRRIRQDELFFALSGSNFDGHDFVMDALDKGAKGAVIERPLFSTPNGKILIKVPSTLRSLGDLASTWRKRFKNLKLAAITGSNGKTTTKEMASSILSLRFSVLKNSGNLNNLIGLPLTLLKLREDHDAAVVELGTNDFGEIRRLSEISLPDIGAITNIGRAHLEKLGGIEGVSKAKGELVEGFTEHNTFIMNMNDSWVQKIGETIKCHKITFGINTPKTHISAKDIETVEFSSVRFKITVEGEELPIRIRGIGLHNVMNALCASGIALAFGCNADEIQAGLERFIPAYMRLEVMDTPLGLRIINDTYNSNPESMRSGVEELVRLKGSGRAIAVLGDMLELGTASETEHRSLGEFLLVSKVDFVITFGKYGKHTLEGLGGRVRGILAETHEEAAVVLTSFAKEGDLALIKGSRGMQMENVIKRLFKE
ncbi:MAG: UDP-N-acetylmuramoyl-tripeptide--D-alanyl-D-alanine ligase [Candidatus Dadabacteria bacterium]|nr:UDP-N-acetylmuramoyl-tripeptide--D-alanyl-D-alanine ligase [Candidatus Dadabacteria bacterium]